MVVSDVVVRAWERSPEEVRAREIIKNKDLRVIYIDSEERLSDTELEKQRSWMKFEEWYSEEVRTLISEVFGASRVVDLSPSFLSEVVDYSARVGDVEYIISLKLRTVTKYYDHEFRTEVTEVRYRALKDIKAEIRSCRRLYEEAVEKLKGVLTEISDLGVDIPAVLYEALTKSQHPSTVEEIIRELVLYFTRYAYRERLLGATELRINKCGNSKHVAVKNLGAVGDRVCRVELGQGITILVNRNIIV